MIDLKHAAAEEGVGQGSFRHAPPLFPASTLNRPLLILVWPILLVGALALASFAAGRIASTQAAFDLRDRALAALPLAAGTLTGEVEKQRLIPLVLARDGAVQETLRNPTPTAQAELDDKLRAIARDAMASVVYVINTDGIAVAASNAGEPTSFVGRDYRFRHYFTDAMADGAATQYALGTVSVRPGLYLSSRVDGPEGPLGVIVVKVELDRVESSWRESGFVVFATDDLGVVLATSVPQWRFGSLSSLSEEEVNAARDRLQLPDATFQPVPFSRRGDNLITATLAERPVGFVAVSQDLGEAAPSWRLSLLIPADAELSSAAMTARATTLLALVLVGVLVFVVARRRRAIRQRQEALTRMHRRRHCD